MMLWRTENHRDFGSMHSVDSYTVCWVLVNDIWENGAHAAIEVGGQDEAG